MSTQAGEHSPNPYVFIVGCPRSGTTLTERILDAHPEIAVLHETRWIPDLLRRREVVTDEGYVTPDIVPVLLAHKRFPQLGLGREDLKLILGTDGRVTYADFVTALFDLCGRARGKHFVGDKTPRYARVLPLLHGLWPRARFVHVIRDGRDVALSALSWASESMLERYPTWREEPMYSAALWWQRNVMLGRETGQELDSELYYELRFESLAADPEREAAALCAYLELPFDAMMLRFNEGGGIRADVARPIRNRWHLPVTPGLREWRTQMTCDDLERFEAAAGDLLDELGYERACSSIRDETLAVLEKVRIRFEDSIRSPSLRSGERW